MSVLNLLWKVCFLIFSLTSFLPSWVNSSLCWTGTQPIIRRDYRGSCPRCGKRNKGQRPAGETGLKWYKPAINQLHNLNIHLFMRYLEFLLCIIKMKRILISSMVIIVITLKSTKYVLVFFIKGFGGTEDRFFLLCFSLVCDCGDFSWRLCLIWP